MKKLISFSRPNLTGNETAEEKERINNKFSEELAKQILDEIDKIEKENKKVYKLKDGQYDK